MSSVQSNSKLASKVQSLDNSKLTSISTNTQSSLIIGSKDGSFSSLNLENLSQEKSIKTDLSSIECFVIDSKDTIWSGSDLGLIQSYTDSSPDKISLKGHEECIVSLHLDSSEQFLYSTSEDCTVRKWDLSTLESEILFKANDSIISADFNNSLQKLALSTSSDMLYLLSINESLDTLSIKIDSKVWSVKLSEIRNFLLVGNNDGQLIVRNLNDLQATVTLTGHESRVKSIELSSDHMSAVTGSFDQKIIVWNLEKFEIKYYLEGPNDWIRGVAIGPQDFNVYSVSDDSRVHMWNIKIDNEEEEGIEIKDDENEIKDDGNEIMDSGNKEVQDVENDAEEEEIGKDLREDRKDDNEDIDGKDRKVDIYVRSSRDSDEDRSQSYSVYCIFMMILNIVSRWIDFDKFNFIFKFIAYQNVLDTVIKVKSNYFDKLASICTIIEFQNFVETIEDVKDLILNAIILLCSYVIKKIIECFKCLGKIILKILYIVMIPFAIPFYLVLSIPAVSFIFLKKLLKVIFRKYLV